MRCCKHSLMADPDGSSEVQNAKRHMDSKYYTQKVSCKNEDSLNPVQKNLHFYIS